VLISFTRTENFDSLIIQTYLKLTLINDCQGLKYSIGKRIFVE